MSNLPLYPGFHSVCLLDSKLLLNSSFNFQTCTSLIKRIKIRQQIVPKAQTTVKTHSSKICEAGIEWIGTLTSFIMYKVSCGPIIHHFVFWKARKHNMLKSNKILLTILNPCMNNCIKGFI